MTDPAPRLHLVVPGRLEQNTGGYRYDARMVDGLRAAGRQVEVHGLEGRFPDVDDTGKDALRDALAGIPADEPVVLDGLAAGGAPDVIRTLAQDRPVVALVHHLLADETGLEPDVAARFRALEGATLSAVRGVVVTSAFTAARVADLGVAPSRIRVVQPGVDAAPSAHGPGPGAPPTLLCVATVTPRKGHAVLVRALSTLEDRAWRVLCIGSLDRDPDFATEVLDDVRRLGLDDRIHFLGEVDAGELDAAYQGASMFVLPSHYEGYGMVLTEAMAHGLPVVATTGGAIPGTVPPSAGLLCPPGDAPALADALASLLDDPARRAALASGARAHAATLPRWEEQARAFGRAVADLVGPAPTAPEGARG